MGDPDRRARVDRRTFGVLLGGLAATGLLASCSSGDDGPAVPESTATAGPPAPERIAYGGHPDQFGELTVPADRPLPRAIVVVVHGGFWRAGSDLGLMRPVAAALVAAGFATWNIEYRRVDAGGGWTATFDDVAMAADHLSTLGSTRFDLRKVYALGHSAGGHLAAWLATRPGQQPGDPGADPAVRVAGVVPLAGVLDLAAADSLGDRAVDALVGGTPRSAPERYAAASPIRRLPLGVPSVCVHGTADETVPISQSEAFVAEATAAGDSAELVRVEGADHMQLIDPAHPGWAASLRALEGLVGG
ncbi:MULTISPECIES: alpha/beta hydrolase family protein [Pseudonocardia]|uniref:alpha/beta hydrolase family protein n=1 Tax=Pseudonocardia TaxID=1847 RepID=UPI001E505AF5|nr:MULTISPECIES: prolyl oligopeptidase family serine peptidase [Pseudonocardia]